MNLGPSSPRERKSQRAQASGRGICPLGARRPPLQTCREEAAGKLPICSAMVPPGGREGHWSGFPGILLPGEPQMGAIPTPAAPTTIIMLVVLKIATVHIRTFSVCARLYSKLCECINSLNPQQPPKQVLLRTQFFKRRNLCP